MAHNINENSRVFTVGKAWHGLGTVVETEQTAEQARQYAIDYQKWSSEKSLSYGELLHFQRKLTRIGKKFDLLDEFKENGII